MGTVVLLCGLAGTGCDCSGTMIESGRGGDTPEPGGGDAGPTPPRTDGGPDDPGPGVGVGEDEPFAPDADESEGVSVSPDDGALVLDSRDVQTHFIWIANTGEGTISKVDTRTFVELARYRTGPLGAGNDPSRTSVNAVGDVFVGNRGGQSLTKISVLGADCPDTNGDGAITTSTGPADVLAWGADDCVLWNTALEGGGIIRAVAAQDEYGPDGEHLPYVWAGGWGGIVWKLDGETGAILVRTESPTSNYGFALDGRGNLWISGRNTIGLGRIDTRRCVDDASCGVEICADDGDSCVKQRISIAGGHNPYGITVDSLQRVWLASHGTASIGRYDPMAPAGARWTWQNVGSNCHGIAADAVGWVWAACAGDGVARLSADDPSSWTMVRGTAGRSAKGMAVDFDGKIWAINRDDDATVITPGAGIADATVALDVANGLVSPYTYSDMTGQQLRLATDPRGHYRRVFEGCPADGSTAGTEWLELRWRADTPPGTSLLFRVRTGASREALAAAAWIAVAEVPPDVSPIDLAAALTAAGIEPAQYLEVEVQLHATRSSATESITPRVYSFGASFECIPFLG